jgi:hypothetical protein
MTENNDKPTAPATSPEPLCVHCERPEGEHSRDALTADNQHGWSWNKAACPMGAGPFHPEYTFKGPTSPGGEPAWTNKINMKQHDWDEDEFYIPQSLANEVVADLRRQLESQQDVNEKLLKELRIVREKESDLRRQLHVATRL